MTDQQPIYVNNELFLGRVEEQEAFRQRALPAVLNPPAGEELPYIILLHGSGGIGKTTLARRFRNIAETEPPFEGACQTLWIDWETERDNDAGLRAGHDRIRIETVLRRIHANILLTNKRWEKHFKRYQQLIEQRHEAEAAAEKALSGGGERDELGRKLVGVSTSGLAKVIRLALPPIGDAGEKIAQAFLEAGVTVGAEQAAVLRSQIESRLKARLDPKQYQLYLNPQEQLSHALGAGLKRVAASKPLLVFFDTYEVIDRVDFWLRVLMKAAGSRLLWVVAGRQNLVKSRRGPDGFLRGYADEFPRRLQDYDVRQLALADLQAYFADAVPERPLSEEEAAVLSQVTRGIPLAIREAAALWKNGLSLADIAGDLTADTPHQTIVKAMTERYMRYAIENIPDRLALYALALAGGNLTVLRAMLAPDSRADQDDLARRLTQLRNRYQAVHRDNARLHDEPADFLIAFLRDEVRRTSEQILQLNRRAAAALQLELMDLEQELPTLEERAEEEDWIQLVLELTRTQFWVDERQGWRVFIPRFVESLAYSRELRQGLLSVVEAWKDKLSRRGKRRLKIFQAVTTFRPDVEAEAEMLTELNKLARPSFNLLAGKNEAERRAILDWQWGLVYFRQQKYDAAVQAYENAEVGLPTDGERLKERLGAAMNSLANELIWPDGDRSVGYNADAARLLSKVVEWLPENQHGWYYLGVTNRHAGKLEAAIAAYQEAIALDPKDAYPHNGLGLVYDDLGRTEAAIAAYRQAIALDPKDAYPHTGLGNVYLQLGRNEAAIAAYQEAIALDPQDAAPHHGLGNVYRQLGRTEAAIAAYEEAIALDPKDAVPHASLAAIYRKMGRQEEYEAILPLARQLVANENEYNRACFEAIIGNVDEALVLLEVALQKRQASLDWARKDPDFDLIRDDPRFQALVGG